MPQNGMLVRIAVALVALATVGALAVASAGAAGQRSTATLKGAGSTLIQPAVQGVWAPAYKADSIQYSGIGSGAGIQAISNRTVDFGASDAPLTKSQGAGCKGCVQIPWALSATSPVINIPGVGAHQLKLTGTLLADIFLGNVTNWNDPAIRQLNKGLSLPNLKITPVHRSDGSGDTYVFTNYLSKVSKQWKTKAGNATTVSWPAGIGGKGNAGVAAAVAANAGSIGYVSIAYVVQTHLKLARLKNAAGSYVLPTIASIESAAQLVKATKIPANNKISITNPPKSKKYRNAYPLSTFTYVIVPRSTPKAGALKAFVTWALGATPQNAIKRYVFAPMPASVVKAAKKSLSTVHS